MSLKSASRRIRLLIRSTRSSRAPTFGTTRTWWEILDSSPETGSCASRPLCRAWLPTSSETMSSKRPLLLWLTLSSNSRCSSRFSNSQAVLHKLSTARKCCSSSKNLIHSCLRPRFNSARLAQSDRMAASQHNKRKKGPTARAKKQDSTPTKSKSLSTVSERESNSWSEAYTNLTHDRQSSEWLARATKYSDSVHRCLWIKLRRLSKDRRDYKMSYPIKLNMAPQWWEFSRP